MKRYALLRLANGGNTVVAEVGPLFFEHAVNTFRNLCPGHRLDDSGYCKVNENISLTLAEFHENYATL